MSDELPLYHKKGLLVWNGTTWVPAAANSSGELVVSGGGGGGGSTTIADGGDVAEGSTTDVAVTGDNAGTVSAKLRGLNKILADVWDSVAHTFKVSVQNASLAVTQSGSWLFAYALTSDFVSGATGAITDTTSTLLLAAPGVGLRNYITTLVVSNSHGTVGTDVVIQDGNGGTTLMTIPAASVYGGATITLPTPLRQPTTNTAIYCANISNGASTKVSAVGYKGT